MNHKTVYSCGSHIGISGQPDGTKSVQSKTPKEKNAGLICDVHQCGCGENIMSDLQMSVPTNYGHYLCHINLNVRINIHSL